MRSVCLVSDQTSHLLGLLTKQTFQKADLISTKTPGSVGDTKRDLHCLTPSPQLLMLHNWPGKLNTVLVSDLALIKRGTAIIIYFKCSALTGTTVKIIML